MVMMSQQPPSRLRAATPTRPSRLTGSSPTPTRPNASATRPTAIRPASSMSSRTPVRAGPSAPSSNSNSRYNNFTTPSRPASSMSNFRPTTPSFGTRAQEASYCGTVKVSIRPRPLAANSHGHNWVLDSEENTVTTGDLGEFQYDHVYDPLSNNHDVYGHTVKPIVDKCMDGFNGTIFAYGMTGSGKTYSMQGSDYEAGIIQLAVNEIYEKIEFEQDRKNYDVSLSYLEIYNEKLYDLLNPDTSNALKSTAFSSTISTSALLKDDLKIRDDPVYGVNIVGLHNQIVTSPDELLTYIAKGDSIRRTGGTDFNARSSRSHAIVMIRIKSADIATGIEKVSTLSLCDLAGSEKATTQQERRKEGAYINKSLLALSTVISKLSAQSLNNSTSSASQTPAALRTHIPYRDSKLTRLLQSSLSGSSVISILCTIHLSSNAVPETINTLRFAARAKNIQLTVKKNETNMSSISSVEKDRMIAKLKAELDKYKKEVKILKHDKVSESEQSGVLSPELIVSKSRKTSVESSSSSSSSSIASYKQQDPQMSKLKDDYSQSQAENQILTEQVEHYKRLSDYSRLNSTMVKNEYVQSLSSLEINKNYSDIREIVVGLENFYKKQTIEIEEMSSYINHLEIKLRQSQLSQIGGPATIGQTTDTTSLMSVVKDQEEEILDLKEQLSSKNSIIQALKNANKVRESLGGRGSRIPSLTTKRSDESMRSNDIYSDMNLSSEMNSSVIMADDFTASHALRPVADSKLNHVSGLNSSPPPKHLEIEDAW